MIFDADPSDSSSFNTGTNTFSSSSTIPGLGALSGKVIKRVGTAVVDTLDGILIRRRMAQIELSHRQEHKAINVKERRALYNDLLELYRPGYSLRIRSRAFSLIMEKIPGAAVQDLAIALVNRPLAESHNLLLDVLLTIQGGPTALNINLGTLPIEGQLRTRQNYFRIYYNNILLHSESGENPAPVGIPFLRLLQLAVMQSATRDFTKMLLDSDEFNLLYFTAQGAMGTPTYYLEDFLLACLGRLDSAEDFGHIARIQEVIDRDKGARNPLVLRKRTLHSSLQSSTKREEVGLLASIIAQHSSEGASSASTFIKEQLPPLASSSHRLNKFTEKTPVEVINADTLIAARSMMDSAGEHATGRTAVLNLASSEFPPKPMLHSQEPCLFYCSTLRYTLTETDTILHYPWPDSGQGCVAGIFSEGVVVHREARGLEYQVQVLPPSFRKVLSVISVSAPKFPPLTPDESDFASKEVKEELKEKVRLVLRIAGSHGKRYVVLGAMGCGVYMCPPKSVAELMKSVLLEKEFEGWFTRIIFAILSPPTTDSNFEIFRDVFAGVQIVTSI
ncbi:hypothetical protein D9757_009325 [Collybiopsis confluens]|uniref:Microbial-type PARG catalytic domain-containing protein n=1 Tax=Collybiopsis confluens TaxID=2823264 RepID=A0A8H5H3T1_9AGAR|nr:hypothetical protein D9757_009325 [Collybiopsis confluens]